MEYTAEQKNETREKTRQLIKDGSLVAKTTCEDCGESGLITVHHENYGDATAVTWVCWPCHRRRHRNALSKRDGRLPWHFELPPVSIGISFHLSRADLAALDAVRGDRPRAEIIRLAIRHYLATIGHPAE
jgi:hypothetical protein